MAGPLDALYFREAFGRQLRRPERGAEQAFIVAPFNDGMGDDDITNMVRITQRSLIQTIDHGEVYYVTAEMTAYLQELIDRHLKHRTVFHLEQGQFPSLTGFVYFDGHIRLPTIYSNAEDRGQDLRAIMWDQFAMADNPATPDRKGVYFGGAENFEPGRKYDIIGKVVYTVCNSPNPRQREHFGPWKMRHWMPLEYGIRHTPDMVNTYDKTPGTRAPLDPKDEQQDREDAEAAIKIVWQVITAWTVAIQQEIPVTHPRPSSYDKVMHKEGRPPADVKVYHLRRYADTPPHGMAEVDWAYRWDVKGHYRWQRVGPGRQFLRQVWVSKHIRGPKDKPYVPRDSVTSLDR